MRKTYAALAAVCVILCVFVIAGLCANRSQAYDVYSVNRDATNCRACHGDFRASPYTSKVDGQSWADDLHDVHRNTMLSGDCETCHFASRFPVHLDSSTGGTGGKPANDYWKKVDSYKATGGGAFGVVPLLIAAAVWSAARRRP